MLIQVIETPNPNTVKFYIGRVVNSGNTAEVFSGQESIKLGFSEEIFNINGVKSVFYGKDFVSVTKFDFIEWNHIKADVIKLLMEEFSESSVFADNQNQLNSASLDEAVKFLEKDKEIVEQIEQLLNTYVIPRLEDDGGFAKFMGYSDGVVYLNLQGACASCPHAIMTLKQGIRGLLSAHLDEVADVVSVDAEGNILDPEEDPILQD